MQRREWSKPCRTGATGSFLDFCAANGLTITTNILQHKDIHFPGTGGSDSQTGTVYQQSLIAYVAVSADSWGFVMDTRIWLGVEPSPYHLVVSKSRIQENLGREPHALKDECRGKPFAMRESVPSLQE